VVERELAEFDRTCSRFRSDSELVLLNRGRGTQPVGRRLYEAIAVALGAAAATDGLVDPTVGRSLRLAGYDRDFEAIRRRARCNVRFVPAGGWRHVDVDEERRTVTLPRGVELDLGATAKALAADRTAAAAAASTGAGILVGLGGDVAVAGPPPPGDWPVRVVEDHAAVDARGVVVSLVEGGLATSSTTVRRWRAGATELHHILDPQTGEPARSRWRTASVAAASCVDANVASTAAVLLGERATGWLTARRLPARLVDTSGAVVTVAGWPAEAAA
jgi:thiamine biosynthesis lipoprotein